MTILVGAWGLHEKRLWEKLPLFVVWDFTAFFIWLASFVRRTIRWRGVDYFVKAGMLVPGPTAAGSPKMMDVALEKDKTKA